MSDALAISNLCFSYRSYGEKPDRPVLERLDLLLPKGSKTLILGPPDGGKSTLCRIICGLSPKYLEGTLEGLCSVDGIDVRTVEPWDLTPVCTLVGQNPQEQLLMTTCADEVAFPLESMGIKRERMVDVVDDALRRWNLHELAEANPQELSGGERKRLLLAVTDAVSAPFWVMDEPFDDLDTYWRGVLLERIQTREGTVIVFASRYLDEFRGSFDRYGLLADGCITIGEEEDAVIAFEQECERHFTPADVAIPEGDGSRLSCTNAVIVHPRRSLSSAQPFTLRVPEFSVSSGEVVALVGPNGSGKSTLSRVLCGLDTAVQGQFALDDRAVPPRDLTRSVGYLFQNPDYGIFLPTVRDELGWSLRHDKRVKESERERSVRECARLFHLDPDDNPSTMSYGARKHLQAAVYYLLDRPFYIIDELDSGVTYAAAFEIVLLLRSRGAGIVLITHDHSFASRLAERQYAIADGAVMSAERLS